MRSLPLRIIPARAGFTLNGPGREDRRGDHPRSRGVYISSSRPVWATWGSSPLARGLRPAHRCAREDSGIIPARAGFTTSSTTRSVRTWDHPRSRGVYPLASSDRRRSPGSSPLARGLRGLRHGRDRRAGIIPARAGFTDRPGGAHVQGPDHPRSRGVYDDRTAWPYEDTGSSPLARGLLAQGLQDRGGARIIPARAGFTQVCSTPTPTVWDHPRSRGVYRPPFRISRTRAGSSPLARGLRGRNIPTVRGIRIIPARAGFTGGSVHVGRLDPDHPRSRGVYVESNPFDQSSWGSSPLARGLHRHLFLRCQR